MYTTSNLAKYAAQNGMEAFVYNRTPKSVQTEEEKAKVKAEFLAALQPGDLVCIRRESGTGHVMLYIGNGELIHSSGSNYKYTGVEYGVETTEASIRRVLVENYFFNPTLSSGGDVFSVATKPAQTASINRFIADTVAASEGTMTGLGTLHPDSETLAADVEQILALGLKGVKLHPDIQGFKIDDYRCLKIYELCEGRLPVLMHTGDHRYDLSNPNRLKPVLEIFRDLTVIGAHFGGWSIWEEATEELCRYENFYVDCSSSLYALSPETGKRLVRRYGAEKVLFGTDYPMWKPDEELSRLHALGLSPEEEEKILYQNAQRIFDISL
jgi:predicted TIM-barrel fold metal-dependent hydrolase